MGAAFVMHRARGIDPMQTGIGPLILINLVLCFVIPNVSVGGHLGGLVGGALAGFLMDRAPNARRGIAVPLAVVRAVGGRRRRRPRACSPRGASRTPRRAATGLSRGKRARTSTAAAAPRRSRGSRSPRSWASARASAAGSPGGTSRPVSPSRMISGSPPWFAATTQQPAAAASSAALGSGSGGVEGTTTTSAAP